MAWSDNLVGPSRPQTNPPQISPTQIKNPKELGDPSSEDTKEADDIESLDGSET